MLDYEYYRSVLLQLVNGIVVPLRLVIGRRAGSKPRALSREIAGLIPFFYTAFSKLFSRKFLVNRWVENPLVDLIYNSSVA